MIYLTEGLIEEACIENSLSIQNYHETCLISITSVFSHDTSKIALEMKFSIKDFVGKCEETADLFTFTEEILNEKLHFLCSTGWAKRIFDDG